MIRRRWKDRPLQERIRQAATWAQCAPRLKAALIEGLRRQFKRSDAGRCHIGAPGNAEEATWDSGDDSSMPKHQQPQLCPLSKVALTKWKAHILNDHQPMRRDSRVCVEAVGQSRHHRRIQHPSAFCLSIGLSGRLKRGTDQFGTACTYILVGCYTFPTTLDKERFRWRRALHSCTRGRMLASAWAVRSHGFRQDRWTGPQIFMVACATVSRNWEKLYSGEAAAGSSVGGRFARTSAASVARASLAASELPLKTCRSGLVTGCGCGLPPHCSKRNHTLWLSVVCAVVVT